MRVLSCSQCEFSFLVNKHRAHASSGKPRLRRKANVEVEIPDNKSDHSSTALGPDETFVEPLPLGTASLSSTEIEQRHATPNRSLEAPEIEALLMSHRARIPVAIAVAQDYSGLPFRLPRPFVVLGWFWVVDAWVSQIQLIPNCARQLMIRSNLLPTLAIGRICLLSSKSTKNGSFGNSDSSSAQITNLPIRPGGNLETSPVRLLSQSRRRARLKSLNGDSLQDLGHSCRTFQPTKVRI